MSKNIKLRLFSYGIIAYMLLAFGWWSVLLYNKNRDAFQAKSEVLKLGMIAEGVINNNAEFKQHPRFQELQQVYDRQVWMILSEGGVIIISLFVGVWFVNQAYNKEMRMVRDRRNFLLSITHELKSPIASIRLVLETIRKRALQPQQKEKLTSSALKETERLHNLVNNLLLSAKLETSYQPFFEAVSISSIVEENVQILQHKHPEATILLEIEPNIGVMSGDKTGLNSVVNNLLENAIKYSPRPAHLTVDLRKEANNLVFSVADKGIGIDNKEKKYIFKKFYRIGNEETRSTKGTGLGLYIVKEIVNAHNGTITVAKNQPCGTVFTIVLPMA